MLERELTRARAQGVAVIRRETQGKGDRKGIGKEGGLEGRVGRLL